LTPVTTDCLFCKIVAGEIPATVVHETEATLAFRDINPQAPTHILLIPKDHIESIAAVSGSHAKLLVEMVQSARHLAKAEGLDGGWRLVTNVGPDAGQSVQHLHFHLLGGRRFAWPPG
jgi:histidine triad (HIT) family protein